MSKEASFKERDAGSQAVAERPVSAVPSTPPTAASTGGATAPAARDNTPECFRGKEGRGRYRVSLGNDKHELEADDRLHAWALFCDRLQKYPSPKIKGLSIQFLGAS